ncbi:MAG: hypothetical protein LUE17_12930 [Planctomycetaceae bacterium]|nr:hypothetical protein [Planctomycetaceae bacterium]
MRSVSIEPLTRDSFAPFGYFADMLNPSGERIGDGPVQFFRDMLPLHLANYPSFSVCRVAARPFIIDTTEMHSRTAEATLSLDADTLIHVGPATPPDIIPLERFRVFLIPKGTLVAIFPGVWHHAAFLYDDSMSAANVIGILPERAYANDSVVIDLPEDSRLKIEMDRGVPTKYSDPA